MKAMTLLLAMLTVLLSVNPCCDEEKGCVDEPAAECADHSEEEVPGSDSPCSPFYACGSCIGFIFHSGMSFFVAIPLAVGEDFTFSYQTSISVGHLSPPLKPPIQRHPLKNFHSFPSQAFGPGAG